MQEHETFQEENWTSIFAGHRLLPTAWDPQVDKVPEQEQMENFRRMLKFIAAEVQAMPSLQAHLDLNSPQSTSDYIF
jgi:tryptophan halogenase